MHNDFTLFTRKVPSGKIVVYFYAYDGDGARRGPWTTGQANKTAARNYCNRLNREGRLLPGRNEMPTFTEYAKGWWNNETCDYLKNRMRRYKLTKGYAVKSLRILNSQLIPYFGKMKLDKISADVIEKWFDHLGKGEEKIKNNTINGYYATLMTMLRWAAKKKIITSDPTFGIQKLMNDRRVIKIITRDEFNALFGNDWQRVWENNRIMYTANKLAALTGMRISEVFGLRGEYVFDDHIYLCAQYDKYGYRETKTKDKNNLPLVPEMIADLKELVAVNGSGFLFSEDGGLTPIAHKRTIKWFYKALINIGISEDEIKKRGLCLHGWRHFINTELLKSGLSILQTQAITRHKSKRMTELYTHFDPAEFAKAREVQESLLRQPKTGEKDSESSTGAKILKMPEHGDTLELKMA